MKKPDNHSIIKLFKNRQTPLGKQEGFDDARHLFRLIMLKHVSRISDQDSLYVRNGGKTALELGTIYLPRILS